MADYKRAISPDMHLAYHRQGVGKEMARCSHTPACCVSKHRSSIEAGKKQPVVWLQHVNRVAVMFLYPSFGTPFGGSKMARNGLEDDSKWRATGNICSFVNKAGFVGLRNYVQEPMKLSSISWVSNRVMKYVII